jgi:hypothetical protein
MTQNRHAFRIGRGMRRGLRTETPLPTRLVSNEEFPAHKGLPLGPVADYNHPRDVIKAAKDFPDIVKEQIFGLNSARVFGVDVNATRNQIPKDHLSRMTMTYLDEGAEPSHRWYGWVMG